MQMYTIKVSLHFNASESKRYSQKTLKEAITGIEEMAADMGGTELHPALKEVFGMNLIQKYDRSVSWIHIFFLCFLCIMLGH